MAVNWPRWGEEPGAEGGVCGVVLSSDSSVWARCGRAVEAVEAVVLLGRHWVCNVVASTHHRVAQPSQPPSSKDLVLKSRFTFRRSTEPTELMWKWELRRALLLRRRSRRRRLQRPRPVQTLALGARQLPARRSALSSAAAVVLRMSKSRKRRGVRRARRGG